MSEAAIRSDPLDELERLTMALPAAQEALRLGEHLGKVGVWLSNQRQAFGDVLALSVACGDLRGAASPAAHEAIRIDLEAIAEFGEALEGACDQATLKEAIDLFGAVRAKVNHLEQALRNACAALARTEFTPLRAAGELFRDLQPNSDLGQRLMRLADHADKLHEKPAADFAPSIRAASVAAHGVRTEVALLVDDPERKAFMEALLGNGATLEQVTPGILDWLSTLQARSRFEVKPHGAAR